MSFPTALSPSTAPTVAQIWAGSTAPTAAQIWAATPRSLTNMGFVQEFAQGTLTATGAEDTVFEIIALAGGEGWVDLSNMQLGDTVVIRGYGKINPAGSYVLLASTTYSGVQTNPAIYALPLIALNGVKLTLQQTAGTNRTYDYDAFEEVG